MRKKMGLVRKYLFNYYYFVYQINATHKLSTVVLLNISGETDIFSSSLWWIESIKEQNVFKIGIFSNIINIYAVTFDHFNASIPKKCLKVVYYVWIVFMLHTCTINVLN